MRILILKKWDFLQSVRQKLFESSIIELIIGTRSRNCGAHEKHRVSKRIQRVLQQGHPLPLVKNHVIGTFRISTTQNPPVEKRYLFFSAISKRIANAFDFFFRFHVFWRRVGITLSCPNQADSQEKNPSDNSKKQ